MPPIRVLLTGASGFLGRHVVERAPRETVELLVARRGHDGFDLADPPAAAGAVAAARPDLVLHLAAVSAMAACERDPALALQVNVHATAAICEVAPRVVFASTDLVFGGDRAPYAAADPPRPRSVYGRTKARAEEVVLARPRGLVVRLPLLFGRSFDGRRGATDMIRAAAATGEELTLFVDEYRTPLHAGDAADVLWLLALGDRGGVVHAAGRERVSRWELGRRFVEVAELERVRLNAAPSTGGLRPKDVALRSDVPAVRTLEAALADS
ncbi:MAG: sugar nucleotide-binding protein [Planctomycetota bacterium]